MDWTWLDFTQHRLFWNNTAGHLLQAELVFLGIMLGGMALGRGLRSLAWRLRARRKDMLGLVLDSLAKVVPLASITVGLVCMLIPLDVPPEVLAQYARWLAVLVVITLAAALFHLAEVPSLWMSRDTGHGGSTYLHDMIAPLLRKTLRVTVFILAGVQIAQILSHQPITSILAGLGVGGLAVALAAQETIKNFFGSLVLAMDRPFSIGDRIQVDGMDGPVVAVGMRSTRLRTLDGHLVTIPNGELANKSIRNVGVRANIQRIFSIGVTYDTAPEKVERAIEILRELLKDHEGQHADFPPRVHFESFGEWSLNIQVMFWYHPADWWSFMAFLNKLNLEILTRFNAEEISFAFPTQTQDIRPGSLELAHLPAQVDQQTSPGT